MNPTSIAICVLSLILGGVIGYFVRAKTHPEAERPLTVEQTGTLIERIQQQTGVDPTKPQAIIIEPPKSKQ